jgi:hypothetical protein
MEQEMNIQVHLLMPPTQLFLFAADNFRHRSVTPVVLLLQRSHVNRLRRRRLSRVLCR